jgi:hypothetical protein
MSSQPFIVAAAALGQTTETGVKYFRSCSMLPTVGAGKLHYCHIFTAKTMKKQHVIRRASGTEYDQLLQNSFFLQSKGGRNG